MPEAVYLNGRNKHEVMAFIDNDGDPPCAEYDAATGAFRIDTLEGTMTARVGDWIVRDAQGVFPYKVDFFAGWAD